MENEQTIGHLIKKARKTAGLTQQELADKAAVSHMSIRRYESGERVPRINDLEQIATALCIDKYELIGWNPIKVRSPFWISDLEEKLKQVGFSIGYYEEDAALWVNYPDGTLEVSTDDLEALNDNINAYLRFQLQELKEQRKDSFRPKKD